MNAKRTITILAIAALGAFAASSALAQHDEHAPPSKSHPAESAPPGEHGGGEHAGGGHHGPAEINWTDISDKTRPAFFALVVNFGLLMAIYYSMGKKPIAEGLKKRRIDIGKDIDDARKMLEEAKQRANKYQADLKNVDVDAATAKAAIVTTGKGEVERLLVEAEEKAERMKRDAERLVEQEAKQLKQDLTLETIERAVTQAQKILEKQATSEDHARLANELLAELQRKPAAPRMQSVRPGAAPAPGGAS